MCDTICCCVPFLLAHTVAFDISKLPCQFQRFTSCTQTAYDYFSIAMDNKEKNAKKKKKRLKNQNESDK